MIIRVIISLFLNVLLDYKSKARRDIYHEIIIMYQQKFSIRNLQFKAPTKKMFCFAVTPLWILPESGTWDRPQPIRLSLNKALTLWLIGLY